LILQRLSIRLALWMVLATVIMQGLHAIYRISVDIPKAKAEGTVEISNLVHNLGPAFAESLYQYNQELSERLLQTFASYPSISRVDLLDRDKKIISHWHSDGSDADPSLHKFEDLLTYDNKIIGYLRVSLDLSSIIDQAEAKISQDIWYSTLMGIASLILLYFVAQRLVTLPISHLSDAVTRFDPHTLNVQDIKSLDNIRANAEIGLLKSAIKSILIELAQNHAENRQANGLLQDLTDHLEEKVKSRTDELAVEKGNAERANQAKTDFVNTVTHELRTPLNSIMGFSSILKGKALPDRLGRLVSNIHSSWDQLLGLVTDIIDYVDLETKPLSVQTFSIFDVVNRVHTDLKQDAINRSLKLLMEVDQSLILKGDPKRLSLTLRQLVSNAIKFTEKGRVEIKASQGGNDQICIVIKDSGPGIDPNRVQDLSESFVQLEQGLNRTKEGVGLGLAITARVCRKWGAQISFSHVEPHGTEVMILLPNLELSKHAKS
jgi:signal transduction histidine kinase